MLAPKWTKSSAKKKCPQAKIGWGTMHPQVENHLYFFFAHVGPRARSNPPRRAPPSHTNIEPGGAGGGCSRKRKTAAVAGVFIENTGNSSIPLTLRIPRSGWGRRPVVSPGWVGDLLTLSLHPASFVCGRKKRKH